MEINMNKSIFNGIIVMAAILCLPLSPVEAQNPQNMPPGLTAPTFDVKTPGGAKSRAVKKGGMLFLVGEDGKSRPAPNGTYRLNNGQALVVVAGKLSGNAKGKSDSPPKNNVQKAMPMKKQ